MQKRCFDLIFSALGLLLMSPLLLLVCCGIIWDGGRPCFFRQHRVGLGGKVFSIVKFRTMVLEAEHQGLAVTATGDRRITRLGKILRKTKIDELPQLWNIFRGEMSFVGPRPEVPMYVALYTPEQRAVLALRPGLTDEASIRFRDEEALLAAAPDPEIFYIETCIPCKIALNLAYARRASMRADLGVMLRTVLAIWIGR